MCRVFYSIAQPMLQIESNEATRANKSDIPEPALLWTLCRYWIASQSCVICQRLMQIRSLVSCSSENGDIGCKQLDCQSGAGCVKKVWNHSH